MSHADAHDPASIQRSWNARYAGDEFAYGQAPNAFLVTCAARLSLAGARVLALGDGEGRNGVWLAQQGAVVTSVDLADAGVAKAKRLAEGAGVAIDARVSDLADFDPGRAAWDAVVSIFVHLPSGVRAPLHRRVAEALRPGGVLVLQAYTTAQLALDTGGPKDAALLAGGDELLDELAGLAIEHRFEGRRDIVEGRLHRGEAEVVEIVARRPA